MKKLLLFGLGVIASLSTLTSCKKDEVVAAPTITFLNGVNQYAAKETDTAYTFVADVVADGEISSIKIFDVTVDGIEPQVSSITKFDSDTKHEIKYTVKLADVDVFKKFKITVTDKKDMTYSASFLINAYQKPAGEITSYTAKLLGAQSASAGSFFSTTNGTVYNATTANQNQNLIDFVYYYGVSNKATIGAPSDTDVINAHVGTANFSTWSTRNKTRFTASSLTALQFDAITDDKEITAVTTLTDSKVNNLGTDKVFAFKTEVGKQGFVKIRNLVADASGSITIDVKVQK